MRRQTASYIKRFASIYIPLFPVNWNHCGHVPSHIFITFASQVVLFRGSRRAHQSGPDDSFPSQKNTSISISSQPQQMGMGMVCGKCGCPTMQPKYSCTSIAGTNQQCIDTENGSFQLRFQFRSIQHWEKYCHLCQNINYKFSILIYTWFVNCKCLNHRTLRTYLMENIFLKNKYQFRSVGITVLLFLWTAVTIARRYLF